MFNRRVFVRGAEPQASATDFARIILGGEMGRPCQVLDRSTGSMRLAAPGRPRLPSRFYIEILASGELVPVEVAWQRNDEVGLSVATH